MSTLEAVINIAANAIRLHDEVVFILAKLLRSLGSVLRREQPS